MRTTFGILGAGAAGAYTRFVVDGLISRRTSGGLPWGTFVVNVSGAFVLGLLATLLTARTTIDPVIRTSLTVGFLGAYTTFSTLAFESARLIEGGNYVVAFFNLAGSVLVGLLAVFAGITLGRALS
ncbi:MAG: fluoride efflux transporter CrcB [Candidatus Dormibacteria bacterium]